MENAGTVKADRIFLLYLKLLQGRTLRKEELAEEFHVSKRTIQRDVSILRCLLLEQNLRQDIITDSDGYHIEYLARESLSNSEILAVCKILLESRSMRKDEMLPILDKLVTCCVPEQSRQSVSELIANEKFHYIEPHHGKKVLDGLWEIGQAIQQHRVMEITYERLKAPTLVTRCVEPVGIMFSEYYFYLTAFIRNLDHDKDFQKPDDLFPTIYRIDRIRSVRVLEEHFMVPYAKRFEEGEFRKRVQFMFGGKLQQVQFRYTGPSLEAILDRLPTAEIVSSDENGWVIRAEVYGKGVDMWLKSQGDYVSMEG